jgi:two-component system LytT family response regulator
MSGPFKVLVVDDEAPARAKVVRFLSEDSRFKVVGEAQDGLEALAQVRELDPHLLILDIQMAGLSGFEVLEALEGPSQVIFATAYDQFALAAFDAAAVDYLLKPFDEERFKRALDRAHLLLESREPSPLKALLAGLAQRSLERLVVKAEDRWLPLPVRSVRRFSAEGKQVRVFSEQGEFLIRRTLQELEQRLDPRRFIRVHRSEIVALEAVQQLEPWDHGDGLLILKGGGHAVLSRTYRKAFLDKWGLEG